MFTTKKLALYSTVAILGLGAASAQADTKTTTSPNLDAGVAVDAVGNKAGANVKAETETTPDMKFTAVDENADSKINEREFSKAVDADTSTSSFAELDTDKDGTLNKNEFDVMAEMSTQAKTKTESSM